MSKATTSPRRYDTSGIQRPRRFRDIMNEQVTQLGTAYQPAIGGCFITLIDPDGQNTTDDDLRRNVRICAGTVSSLTGLPQSVFYNTFYTLLKLHVGFDVEQGMRELKADPDFKALRGKMSYLHVVQAFGFLHELNFIATQELSKLTPIRLVQPVAAPQQNARPRVAAVSELVGRNRGRKRKSQVADNAERAPASAGTATRKLRDLALTY